MRRLVRNAAISVVALCAVSLAAVGGLLWSSLPAYDGEIQVAGITAPVVLARDENAVPHIFAQTKADGYFGLGYVHAQDRLWQLELTRRIANGRLAEAVGEDALSADTLVAAFDVEGIAQRTEAGYSAPVRQAIAAYVKGINAAIALHRGPWPPEFMLLGIEPRPWTVRDVSRAGALVTLGFGDWRDELLRARLLPRIGCTALRSLYASEADPGPVSYPAFSGHGPVPADSCGALQFARGEPRITALLPFGRAMPASNGWAVAGRKTVSGQPLLANDPHGPLTAPADYYLARISGPGFDIVGASRPGSPGFASGRNDRIAWGVTDMMIDQADIVVEQLATSGAPDTYQRGRTALAFSVREVAIPIRGKPARTVRIRSTQDGPVVSDFDGDARRLVDEQLPKGHVAVLRGLRFPDGLPLVEALVGMADARDLDSFRAAIGHFRFQQNFVFAQRNGPIAILAAAHLPQRRGDGFLPVPGGDARFESGAAIPAGLLPANIDPGSGLVLNANNRIASGRGRFDSASFEPGWRARTIADHLAVTRPLSMDDMRTLQLDIQSAEVSALRPVLMAMKPASPSGKSALELLRQWDGKMQADRAEPLIWNAWVRQFALDLLRPRLGDLADVYLATQRPRLARLTSGEGGWCQPSTCPEIAAGALDTAVEALARSQGPMAGWQWGHVHKASFTHDIFSHLPVVGRYLVRAPATGGDAMTVNSGQTALWSESPFGQDYGPRYRQIIDLAAPEASLFMIAPGVSGHPASRWFGNFVQPWADGQYVKVSGDPSAVAKRGIGRLVLQPASNP